MTRLHYETKGGHVSEADTFAQLLEHLRLAQEALSVLGHLRKANGDEVTGQGFIAAGELMKLNIKTVTSLAVGKIGSLQ